jgi:iron(II)-dependent oxidoreductase
MPNYDPDGYSDESPVRLIRLAGYRIGRYPVTVQEYLRFMESGGYEDESLWQHGGFGENLAPVGWDDQLRHLNRPVTVVSWFEASAYAAWVGGRLPTEAEWERAARGVECRRYPWGDEEPIPKRLNYRESGIGHATPVGIYPLGTTPDCILDMAGNIWEWCLDWYGDYDPEQGVDPTGPDDGDYRVIRGGAWNHHPRACRCANRNRYAPGFRGSNFGFRVIIPLGDSA